MKKGLSELVFILDRSGSMSGLEKDTIGGFNSLIEKQRKEDGTADVTLVLFDSEYDVIYDHVDIKDVAELTSKEYFPRGTTALLDAVGTTINRIGERLSNTPEEERPEQVIIVITTDGYENASKEFTRQQVKDMIEHQQSKYSWTFMFLGANMDAVGEAQSLGIDTQFSKTYTNSARGVGSVYASVAMSMSAMRNYSSVATDDIAEEGESLTVEEERSRKMAYAKHHASVALDNVE